MPSTVRVSAVQMDAAPAPVEARLARAADLIAEAASAGAQLVVLPEVFNTGYEYTDQNYRLPETVNGPTLRWMKAQAAEHRVHLAGTFLLLDVEDVYNSAFLVAPDGRTWRYDKQYPFLWERAYFREGHGITVAETDLGKLGMMICWDSAHSELWERYAGKVDALLVMSCPPKLGTAELVLPDGARVGPLLAGHEESFPGRDMDEHAGWLGVPVIHTSGAGRFRSPMPLSLLSMGSLAVLHPELMNRLGEAEAAHIEADYYPETKVIDAHGRVLARVTESGDSYTLADVTLSDTPPQPAGDPPPMRTQRAAYFLADIYGASAMVPIYRRGVRRQWGARMAPLDPRTRIWAGVTLSALAAGWALGRGTRRLS